ncbi:hypothetical protein C8R41DRAFT_935004 [Lentinula lateritia]|uniref:DNA/RNA non-specific endonuclease/pyrophosphatase/phosphodiesterase domain-containing protein n=1 Tax=Lentinula lateritia TaxID=40482 RepID=A0ABQ8VR72_9AGAR|nr:hypothetical protein C8R41DRAFT_935004 [Lentinula lateritia]
MVIHPPLVLTRRHPASQESSSQITQLEDDPPPPPRKPLTRRHGPSEAHSSQPAVTEMKDDQPPLSRKTHEVICSPVSVPTDFAKVVLTSKPASPSNPNILELTMSAFVLPNAPIPDNTPLEKFVMPVEAVERAAALALFSDAVKSTSKHIC